MSELKMPYREQNSNKRTFGKVLNFAGSKNYIGAAYLSSVGLLKSGAGYAALSTEENIIRAVSALLPEAVFLSRNEGVNNLDKYDVILLGCGLGQSIKSKKLFKNVIKKACDLDKSILIDADGLNILADLYKQRVNEIIRFSQNDKKNLVITPHPAEAARLLGYEMNEILNNLESSAKILSEKFNCVTVLKTHRTIVCSKSGEIYVNEYGNSALAKAGTGDVLAGIIAGLSAQNMDLYEAAKLGVYLHSRAGEIASEDLTEYSVLASDLIKYLPLAIKEINQ